MGAVGFTSDNLVRAMLGQPLQQERKLRGYAAGTIGTPNQRYMGAAAALYSSSPALRDAAAMTIGAMLRREEQEGPRPWELLCPDPHEGMYLLARVGIIGSPYRNLARRCAAILSQELRLADLVAAPDGDCRGLPGARAPLGAALGRRALTHVRTEVRRRQGFDIVHRGTGGRARPLKWEDGDDPLVNAPAWWLKLLLDTRPELLAELAPDAPLPARLRLPLTVHRWDEGTLAVLADPGPERRGAFVVHGSAAAKRDKDRDEDPTTWICVTWDRPGRHRVTAGESWETAPPDAPPGAELTYIPGLEG